jgi:Tfp pilus assembly protein PilW
MKNISFNQGSRQTGFSLVDVMVGMVLSLLGTIIIFQVFEVSERIKRTTTSGGDAQQNGAAALFALERGVRQAGYGINANDGAPLPLQIIPGAANLPDSVTVRFRDNWDYGPFAPANALVFGTPPALTVLNYCVNVKAQLVTRIVPCTQVAADVNDVVLVEGIAQFKALPVTDASATTVAMQLAIVARSSQPEKPDPASGQCNITTNPPSWIGGTVDLTGMVGLTGDDWKCYRYKVFEVTVPLRNVLWRP